MQFSEFKRAIEIADKEVARSAGYWKVNIFVGYDEQPVTTYFRRQGFSPRQILNDCESLDGYPMLVHKEGNSTDVVSLASVTHVRVIV